MAQSLKWRALVYVIIIGVALVYLLPTFIQVPAWWEKYLPSDKISLGLDLQGGMHLILEVDTEKALENTLERNGADIEDLLYNNKIPFDHIKRISRTALEVALVDPETKDRVKQLLEQNFPALKHEKIEQAGETVTFTLAIDDLEARQIKKAATEQALETIRAEVERERAALHEERLQWEASRRAAEEAALLVASR